MAKKIEKAETKPVVKEHNFNEKVTEQGCKVIQTERYVLAKKKAIELIDSGKYNLLDDDFWIQMTFSKDKKYCLYNSLIISHVGCEKINDVIADKFKPECYHPCRDDYTGGLKAEYLDETLYEVGEVTKENCKNAYPNAMLFKRTFDRVVLKKSKLYNYGVYSEEEAEEFKAPTSSTTMTVDVKTGEVEIVESKPATKEQIDAIVSLHEPDKIPNILEYFKVDDLSQLSFEQANWCIQRKVNKK